MSRSPPGPQYNYAAPQNYYYEEPDGCVGDYADSDALSERSKIIQPPSNVTEIYRRKLGAVPAIPPPHENYRQNLYLQPK